VSTRKTLLRLVVVITAFAMVVSACGSDTSTGSTTTTASGTSGTADTQATATTSGNGETPTTQGDTTPPDDSDPEPTGDDANETLVIGMGFSPRKLWANSSTTQQEINISEQISEKLIEFSPDAQSFEPRLAESWEQIDDTTLEMKLREGVTFTNGEPFTAESAVFSIDVMRNSAAYTLFTSAVAGAEVVGPMTIHVKTEEPTGLHMPALAVGSFQYPPEYFQQVGEDEFGKMPIGTGPYMLDEWIIGEEVRLVANPDYWGGVPDIENVIFRSIPEETSRIAALQTEEIGLLLDLPLDAADRIEEDSALQVLGRPGNRLYRLTFGTLIDTPIADPAVRRALQYAIDVDSIIAGPLEGRGEALKGQALSTSYFGYDPDREQTPYDPELARELLAEAGYPDGFKVTLKYPSGRYTKDQEVGQIVAANLQAVGLEVEQVVLEPGTFLDQLNQKELNDIFFSGTLPPPDAHFVYFQLECAWRYAYICRPELDALIRAGTQTADIEERIEIYNQIREFLDEDPATVPMYVTDDLYGAVDELGGFIPRASQFLDVRAFTLNE
jgi:peptide/nickel transport system substrate-binding protein